MKNNIVKTALALSAFILALSCNEDDLTGQSTQQVKSPSLSVALSFDENQTLVEMETSYPFTVNLSEPQIADVVVYLTQTGGNATEGEDFSFPHSLRIPAGTTSLSDAISIHADEINEGTETVTIKIGTGLESNVSGTASKTVTFNIQNVTSDDLAIGMSWEAAGTVTDNSGNEIGPTDLADLILSIVDASGAVVHQADGGSFEATAITSADPDGVYSMVASFYAASNIPSDLNLTASFDQVGIINGQTHSFAAALNTGQACSAISYTLAQITKTGGSYAIEEVGVRKVEIDQSAFVGTWTGTTSYGHPTQVVTSLDVDGNLQITGIGVGFMTDDWGEVIITQETLPMNVDTDTGEFTIDEALYMTTTFEGDPQPAYNLSAVGTLNPCTGAMYLDYDFVQDGTSYTEWLTEGNGWPPFVEDITLE